MWLHFLITLCNNGPQRAFDTYSPSIVSSFGFPALTSNALASVGLFLQIPTSWVFSWVSDHYDKRGQTVIAGFSCHLLGYIFNRIFTEFSKRRGVKYFGVVWTQTFGTFSHPLNIAWLSLTCNDSEQRALAMAGVIMGANIAGIYGAQIFRRDDRPKYRRGFSIACAVLAVGLGLAIFRFIDEQWQKRRNKNKNQSDRSSISDAEQAYNEKHAVPPSEVQPAPIIVDDIRRPSVSKTVL